jgi:predicted RNA-binding Zn-ribbon protein involved in translation (DUF1610 family)
VRDVVAPKPVARPPLFVVKTCAACGIEYEALRTSKKRNCPDCRRGRFTRRTR